jgi:hypothetical protein
MGRTGSARPRENAALISPKHRLSWSSPPPDRAYYRVMLRSLLPIAVEALRLPALAFLF